MPSQKPVTIVGGGLSGLTLGIGLRRAGVPVILWEAGRYPRHRVCGEFVSGRGQATLARLGLRRLMEEAGSVEANTAAFFSRTNGSPSRRLPSGAICLSRFDMDHALAEEFRKLGGELLEGRHAAAGYFGEGFVRATGRRRQAEKNNSRWFGLKMHAIGDCRNAMAADLEMHVSANGYVGLCRINGGRVNVCGLFRRDRKRSNAQACGTKPSTCTHAREEGDARQFLKGVAGSILNERMERAVFDEDSFCAVAGLSLRPERAASRAEICVGDSITMIPPLTGNGMSMAFESAEMAMGPLMAWSRGELSWAEAQRAVARLCDAAFSRRLAWAKWLQALALAPALQDWLVLALARSEWCWRMLFEKTR